ncbi:MAG: hypothetical protein FJ224_09050 [Lentisphaerae bacterium]|nr:hypothetical protein [Lentisphaerota bacterium]
MRKRLQILVFAASAIGLASVPAFGQSLRFGNHREIEIPQYATVRIGPFYSTLAFSLSCGARYVDTWGAGADFLANNERGGIRKDGFDAPIVAAIEFRNYLLITRQIDLDMSVRVSYDYYPFETQNDELDVDVAEEGIQGMFSSQFRVSQYLQGNVYDQLIYKTDYVDTRGIEDRYGGFEYEYFRNRLGADLEWKIAKKHKAGVGVFREDNIPFSDGLEAQEYVLYQGYAGYSYRIISGLGLGVRGTVGHYDYAEPARPDATIQDFGLELLMDKDNETGYRLSEYTTLRLRLGLASGYSAGTDADATGTNAVAVESDIKVVMTAGADLNTQLSRQLRQTIGYERGLRGAFNTAFEVFDLFRYRLDWDRQIMSWYAFTQYGTYDPDGSRDELYNDWHSAVGGRYPLRRSIFLTGEAGYVVRDNTSEDPTATIDAVSDYETAYAKLGTEFELTKKTRFRAYVQRIQRMSDEEELEYGRDMAAMDIVYRHQF